MNIGILKTTSNTRIADIDGVRGLCAIIVIFHHFASIFLPRITYDTPNTFHISGNFEQVIALTPLNLIQAGNFAVYIFLTVSGYVLANQYFKNHNTAVYIATMRFFRFLIPVLGSTFLGYLILKFGFSETQSLYPITGSELLPNIYNITPSFIDFLKTTVYDVFFVGIIGYNSALWMMPSLFLSTFTVYLFLFLWSETKNRWIIYSMALIILFLKNLSFHASAILGFCIADIEKSGAIEKVKKQSILFIFVLLISLFLGSYPTLANTTGSMYQFMNIGTRSYEIYHMSGAFLFLFALRCLPFFQKIMRFSILQYLGKISFSLYLVHMAILVTLGGRLFLIFYAYTERYLLSAGLSCSISLIFILVVAHIYESLVVKNTNQLSRKIFFLLFHNTA